MALTLIQMKAQFQDPMRQGIVDMLWQSSRVMQTLTFVPHSGLAFPYTKRSALPGVAFRSMNEQFTATAGTTNPAVEQLTILGGKIKTDSVAIALKGQAARTNEIAAQMESAGKFFDKTFFTGDPATTPKSFLGLKGRLSGGQLLTNATNGAVPSWKQFVKLLDQVEGPNEGKVLAMNQTTRRLLSEDVAANAGGMGVFDVGRQLATFGGAKITEVYYDETETAILPFTETCGTSTTCCSAYAYRPGGQVDERGVQGITGLPEVIMADGPFNFGEYLEDVVQMVVGIGVFGGYVAARLQGIKAS